jgi:hypothetical protein
MTPLYTLIILCWENGVNTFKLWNHRHIPGLGESIKNHKTIWGPGSLKTV